jgi:hypothetical protein
MFHLLHDNFLNLKNGSVIGLIMDNTLVIWKIKKKMLKQESNEECEKKNML